MPHKELLIPIGVIDGLKNELSRKGLMLNNANKLLFGLSGGMIYKSGRKVRYEDLSEELKEAYRNKYPNAVKYI